MIYCYIFTLKIYQITAVQKGKKETLIIPPQIQSIFKVKFEKETERNYTVPNPTC